jgi:hypothetical protein
MQMTFWIFVLCSNWVVSQHFRETYYSIIRALNPYFHLRVGGTDIKQVGFEVLTAVRTKMTVFWVVEPCSLVEVYQRFRGPWCLQSSRLIALMMEAARTSEKLVNFYQTTRRYHPEDSHLNTKK